MASARSADLFLKLPGTMPNDSSNQFGQPIEVGNPYAPGMTPLVEESSRDWTEGVDPVTLGPCQEDVSGYDDDEDDSYLGALLGGKPL